MRDYVVILDETTPGWVNYLRGSIWFDGSRLHSAPLCDFLPFVCDFVRSVYLPPKTCTYSSLPTFCLQAGSLRLLGLYVDTTTPYRQTHCPILTSGRGAATGVTK